MSDDLSRLTAAEDARAAAHAREAARHRGVCWSACGPGPFRRRGFLFFVHCTIAWR